MIKKLLAISAIAFSSNAVAFDIYEAKCLKLYSTYYVYAEHPKIDPVDLNKAFRQAGIKRRVPIYGDVYEALDDLNTDDIERDGKDCFKRINYYEAVRNTLNEAINEK